METFNQYGWLAPTGKILNLNNMITMMASQYIKMPIQDALTKLGFLQLVSYKDKIYAIRNKEISREQIYFCKQNNIDFIEDVKFYDGENLF